MDEKNEGEKNVSDKKYLYGKRVHLRPFQQGDHENIYYAFLDPDFRKLTGTQYFLTMESIEKAYENFKSDKSRIDLVITLSETEEAIADLALNEINLSSLLVKKATKFAKTA
ncbi:hypothetical protein GCM10009865_39730 [Aeromicrobium ponti]|uniref:Uncharacterized protein n=1 Tax=Cytobacillus oceanisediminis TaxID=665099 RepID=A0A562JM91_9BACI|nr:hypothetical protein [Cytobacillus oceanisediminis]TWH84095.1 hypothetical protein IQ19_03762 [Cytobacillus oceanisediminis]